MYYKRIDVAPKSQVVSLVLINVVSFTTSLLSKLMDVNLSCKLSLLNLSLKSDNLCHYR